MKNLILGTLFLTQFAYGTESSSFKTETNTSEPESLNQVEIKKDSSDQKTDDKFEIDSQELVNFKEEILNNKTHLDSASISIKMQNLFPKNVFALIINSQTDSKDSLKTLEQAYTNRNDLLTDIANEINKRNHKIRKEIERRKLLIKIFLIHFESIEHISVKSSDIINISDVSERYDTVQKQYNKLALFKTLLGREDLGVEAKPSDLSSVSKYLNKNEEVFPSKEFDVLVDQFNVFVKEIKGNQ